MELIKCYKLACEQFCRSKEHDSFAAHVIVFSPCYFFNIFDPKHDNFSSLDECKNLAIPIARLKKTEYIFVPSQGLGLIDALTVKVM